MAAASDGHRACDLIAEKYLLLRVLEIGGMGAVWVAHHLALDVHVAIKFILPDLDSPAAEARLLLEAQTAARVRHPAIVHVLDVGRTAEGEVYLAMELLEGELFADVLGRERRLDPETAIRVLLPIVEALDALHRSGSLHRDIKPENVFLARNDAGRWQPKLIDFGLARRIAGGVGRITHHGTVMGTPVYMSRERLLGEDVDAREDIYSLSVVLYQALTGALPFDGDNPMELVAAMTANCPKPTVDCGAGDAELWEIVRRGLAPRSERWESAGDLGRALAGWLWRRGGTDDIAGVSLRTAWIGEDDTRCLALTLPSKVPTARFEALPRTPTFNLVPSPVETALAPVETTEPFDDLADLGLDAPRAAAPVGGRPRRGALHTLAASAAVVAVVGWSSLLVRSARPEGMPSDVAPDAVRTPVVPQAEGVAPEAQPPPSSAPSTCEPEEGLSPSGASRARCSPPCPNVARAPIARAPVSRPPVTRPPVTRAASTRIAPQEQTSAGADEGTLALKNPYE